MKAVICLFTPKDSDLKNNDREKIRRYLARKAGITYLEIKDFGVFAKKFSNFGTLISRLNDATQDTPDISKLGNRTGDGLTEFANRPVDDRRMLKIKLEPCNPLYDARRFQNLLPQHDNDGSDGFCDETIGKLEVMSGHLEHKKIYFKDVFETGIAICKVYEKEVYKRIPLQEAK